MKALIRTIVAHACALCVTGCVIDGNPSAVVTSSRPSVLASNGASSAVIAGRSTKADVIAALGPTQTIQFDSGYEVWVYRLAVSETFGPRFAASDKAWPPAPAEFVILFGPSGVVAKTRMRPAS